MHPTITIAMASYNGARFIRAQLDSIARQSVTNWRLVVSDDGSTDETRQIIAEFARERAAGQVQLIEGPRHGATRNFLHLTRQADPQGWLAYADQDDFWLPDRLERGVAFLSQQTGPGIYAARTTICDENLEAISPAPAFPGPFGFRNALIQACLPGNTILANSAALGLLQAAAPAAEAADIVSHDWWAYQLLSGVGASIRRDTAQVLLYRQHPENVMGRNDTMQARFARFSMLFDGRFAEWLGQNQRALEPVAHLMLPESQALLKDFGRAIRASGPQALYATLRMGLYRQSRAGTAAILAAAVMGRLRKKR